MHLFLLVFPLHLLLPSTYSACINCGGADKTSAKRLKMPNKSVFTRLAGIELMEIFEITNQINHEVCAQQCDAHTECAVFEFNLPNKLCVLASEYARLSDDLTKGAFETIVFVKVRGKFTKALPKDKETCLDKSEYEDYVKHEVDKWLNPTPKKDSSTRSGPLQTTESGPALAQTTDSTLPKLESVEGTSSTNGEGGSMGVSSEATTMMDNRWPSTRSEVDAVTTVEATVKTQSVSPTQDFDSPPSTAFSIQESDSPTTAAGSSRTSSTPTSTTMAGKTTTSTATAAASTSSADEASGSESYSTVTKEDSDGREEENQSTPTSMPYPSPTIEEELSEPTTEITTPENSKMDSSTSTWITEDPPSTTDKVTSTNKPTDKVPGANNSGNGLTGKRTLKSVLYSSFVVVSEGGIKQSTSTTGSWNIQETEDQKVTLESLETPGHFIRAESNGSVSLATTMDVNAQWIPIKGVDGSWAFRSQSGKLMTCKRDSSIKTVLATIAQPQDRFYLEMF